MAPLTVFVAALAFSCQAFAFTPSTVGKYPFARSSAVKSTSNVGAYRNAPSMSLADMDGGGTVETGGAVFDPLGLGTMGSDATLAFFRHAEIKHGRVAMAAFVGWLVQCNHIHFPGSLTMDGSVTFEQLSQMSPPEAWRAIPFFGKLQMAILFGAIEHQSEYTSRSESATRTHDAHYMKGGKPGDLTFLKWFVLSPGLKRATDAQKAKGRLIELKNGRLAMLAMAAIGSAAAIPGSVPIGFPGFPFWSGEGFIIDPFS